MDNSRQFYEYHSQVPSIVLFEFIWCFLLRLQHSEESWTFGRMPQDRLQPHDMQSKTSMHSTLLESEHLKFIRVLCSKKCKISKYIKYECEHHTNVMSHAAKRLTLVELEPPRANTWLALTSGEQQLASATTPAYCLWSTCTVWHLFGHDTLPHKNTQHT